MTIKHIERPLSIKSLKDDGTFMGYASVFDVVDSYKETVKKGAFRKSIQKWSASGYSPLMLWMHDPTQPIGVWYAMAEDKKGLVVFGKLALGTQRGKEAYELMKMKALTGLSIGYKVVSSEIDRKRKIRILTDVNLFEVSLVSFPANDKARVCDVKKTARKITKRKITRKKKPLKRRKK